MAIRTFPRRHLCPLEIAHYKHLTRELDSSLHLCTQFQTFHWSCSQVGSCSSEVQAPDQGVSWTSLCGGVLNVSSWKETQRSLSGPGEAGGEEGLVLDYQWKMEGIPHITDVSYQCP